LHHSKKIPQMKIKTLLFPVFLLLMISCTKSKTDAPPQDDYLTTTAGSSWNYHETDSASPAPVNKDYTLTSTSRDSVINSKSYHVYSNSGGGNQYFYVTGADYYQYDSLPAGFGTTVLERFYLVAIAPVGFSWAQTLSVTLSGVSVPVTLTYSIAEKGISRNVNGTNYTDVIHVTTSISSSLIPAASLVTNINSYYAERYGLIETSNIIHLNYMGFKQNVNTDTKLVSATLL
jgi:hypothetical protein